MALPLPKQFTKYFEHHNPTQVKNLLITAEAVFESRTTNLNVAKNKVGNITGKTDTKPESNYKRLTRLFTIEEKREIAKSLLCVACCCLDSKMRIKYLALDGTSWEYGEKKIHLLTLSVVYSGVSIPIWWEELEKKGHSNFKERKKVIREACKIFNLKGLILLADREYIGRKWFNYLKNKKIDFIIRLKEKVYKKEIDKPNARKNAKKKIAPLRYIKLQRMALFQRYRNCGVSKQFKMSGNNYTFVVFKIPKKNAKENLIYFISSLKNKKEIVKAYPIRWTIESCFKHLKSNGFNLEEMNFKNPLKIMLMMAITVFLYVLCIVEGLKELKKSKPSDLKKYANGKHFLTISVFSKGLSYLCLKFNNLITFIDYLYDELLDKNLLFLQNVQ
jgi:hypothetical protein